MRWLQQMACKVNASLWINGCVNFNRDFSIQIPIASRFHCKTIVLKKVFTKKLYIIKSTKRIYTLYMMISVTVLLASLWVGTAPCTPAQLENTRPIYMRVV